MSDAPDFEAAGLLEGLEGDARDERLALLEYLFDEGNSLEDLRRASDEGALIFMRADQAIGGSGRLRADEIVERTGIELDYLYALRRATGLPVPDDDSRVYTDSDVRAAELAVQAEQAGLPREDILDLTRVLGRGLSQAAELMRTMTLKLVLEPGLSERDLAIRYAEAASRLGPMTGPLVDHMLRVHLRQMARNEAISALERIDGQLPGSREINVAFADLVGFTRRGEEVPADELGRLAARLEELAVERTTSDVRLVKTIGDAAMLTAGDPGSLLDVTLSLVDAADAEGEEFPQLRAGIASGQALNRAGDWYGQPVNLASRITAIARPGSVLVPKVVRDATGEDRYRWSFAGERRLKGIRAPVPLYRVRPLAAEAS